MNNRIQADRVSYASHIGQVHKNWTLVDYLAKRFTYFSTKEWTEKILSEDVLLNSQPTEPNTKLNEGDEVRYLALSLPEPKIPKNIPILFEDEDLLIVNKPPHLPVHPCGRYLRNTLIHQLQERRKHSLLILAHRLDRETSGVCVLSKTHLAKEKMYWQFFRHETEKVYWALCWGEITPPAGTIDLPIGDARHIGSNIRIKKGLFQSPTSKQAKTKYRVLSKKLIQAPHWTPPEWPALKGRTEGPWPVSLVECRPITGRTNQIRIHMNSLGTGIIGDKLYDPDESVFMEMRGTPPVLEDKPSKRRDQREVGFMNLSQRLKSRLVLDAHALHAKSLEFRHPRTQKKMKVEAPLPESWRGLY